MKFKIFISIMLLSSTAYAQSFTGSFDLLISQERTNGTTLNDTISYFFAEDKTAIIMRDGGNQPDLKLIFIPADSTITGLFEMKGNKGGYLLPMNEKQWPGMTYALSDYGKGPKTQLNYTGNTKKINEYDCSEIYCENEEYDMRFWLTNDIELSLTQIMAYQTVGSGGEMEPIKMLSKCGIQSFSMLTLLDGKKGKQNVVVSIENFSSELKDPSIFNTEGYLISDMRDKL